MTEYLIGSFVIVAMSIAGLLYLVLHFNSPAIVAGVALGVVIAFGTFLAASAIAIILRFHLIGTIVGGLARIGMLRGRLRPDMEWINRLEDQLLVVLRDRPLRLIVVLLIEIAAQALLVLELFGLIKALDLTVPLLFPFIIDASLKVIGIIFLFIPMQVGVAEGTYSLVFSVVGLPAAAGFALAFLRRIRSFLVASIGLAILALLTRRAEAG
jgi:hypothetical protein